MFSVCENSWLFFQKGVTLFPAFSLHLYFYSLSRHSQTQDNFLCLEEPNPGKRLCCFTCCFPLFSLVLRTLVDERRMEGVADALPDCRVCSLSCSDSCSRAWSNIQQSKWDTLSHLPKSPQPFYCVTQDLSGGYRNGQSRLWGWEKPLYIPWLYTILVENAGKQ